MRRQKLSGLFGLGIGLLATLDGAAALPAAPAQLPAVATIAVPQLIFPEPKQTVNTGTGMPLDARVSIAVPTRASEHDLFLARALVAELSDWYGIAMPIEHLSHLPAGKHVVLMGTFANPLVKEYVARHKLDVTAKSPGPEGYVLQIEPEAVVVAGSDDRGAFHGYQSFRQVIAASTPGKPMPGLRVRDWPHQAFRGVKIFMPGRENIPFFKRFIADFMALYKFNQLVLEVNAGMRFDRHPELNAGWIDFAKDHVYTRRDRPGGPRGEWQDSTHYDTADGRVLEKDEVADLVRWSRRHHIDVVAEVPSLSHSYYLLTRHRELADYPKAEWPDAYCPSDPRSRKLLFDVFDELIDVIKPSIVHIGRDEWRTPVGICPHCAGKDPRDLMLADLLEIHNYLTKKKHVRVALWGDHFIEELRGKIASERSTSEGLRYQWPGGLPAETVYTKVPKDILIFNWFWRDWRDAEGELGEKKLVNWGFEQVYGNMLPNIPSYDRRSRIKGMLGGAPSSWAATTEFIFGKDLIWEFVGSAGILWSSAHDTDKDLLLRVQAMMPDIRRNFRGQRPPSEDGDPVKTLDIAAQFNGKSSALSLGVDLQGGKSADLMTGRVPLHLAGAAASGNDVIVAGNGPGAPPISPAIPVGKDVSSLVFLHASRSPAGNLQAHSAPYNPEDTTALLGYYEAIYDDGLVATIPLRYGVNILEVGWRASKNIRDYCYQADAVAIGSAAVPPTLWAFEWVNPRFGKKIKTVRLHARAPVTGKQAATANLIVLKALSYTAARDKGAVRRSREPVAGGAPPPPKPEDDE